MRVLFVHPGPLMYTKVFLRLEPLGLELVAGAARQAGHEVRLVDLQVEHPNRFYRELRSWRPDAVAFSGNYLPNVPEIVDRAKEVKAALPDAFVLVGGHSVSFIADDLLLHGGDAIDCILRGEGEASVAQLLLAVANDRHAITHVPGVVTAEAKGPAPRFVHSLDDLAPARDLLLKRRRYFIGVLDPCASIEFSRGCPWDCAFCSAWTFYGRSYRTVSPEKAVDDLQSLDETGVFIVDDVAFVHAQHGLAIGEEIARRGIKKQYYIETRGDVLLRNKEVFQFWKRLGLNYMFLGLESIDEEGLQRFRKRVPVSSNFEALEFARSLGIRVAVNIIADPDWDRDRFETIRKWAMDVPEIVNISVNTPYPGTETWLTEERAMSTRDYRLFDIQHAVLPTKLPLPEFYLELVRTQHVLNTKHLSGRAVRATARIATKHIMRGQFNFVRMLWQFRKVYDANKLLADHGMPVTYQLPEPPDAVANASGKSFYVHAKVGRAGRAIDNATEAFVDATRGA